MLKVPVLLFVLGSASLWVLAEGASTALPEDDITTGIGGGTVHPGVEDTMVTSGPSKKPQESTDSATLMPASTTSTAHWHSEDLPTHESTHSNQKTSHSTTAPNVATDHSMEKMDEETQITVEKDGLATATLLGIIIGVLGAIAFIGGIIYVVMRKMSGRP